MSSRRFSVAPLLFLALWALLFLLPPTREAARSQWKARLVTFSTPAPDMESSRDGAFVRALDEEGVVLNKSNKRRGALEELGRRFPGDAAICAAQIVASSGELHLGQVRQPGPSSNPDLNWSVKLAKVQTPSPELLKSWFAATARGAKLEPNNTFWDWAQIMGLLAARRDDEVWAVLRAARTKTGYDDHTSDSALARLSEGRRRLGMMSPISQMSISAAMLFPHYAVMREAARQVSDDASGLRLAGGPQKQKQALEGARDFMFLARVMRRESKVFINSLVGQAIEAIAMWGGSYSPTRPIMRRRVITGGALSAYAKDPRSLLFFARQLKRADVAAELGREWSEIGKWRSKTKVLATTVFVAGLDMRDLMLAQAADWFGALLLAGLPTLLVWALACSLALRFVPAWRREGDVQLSRVSWAWGGVLSLVALLELSAAVLWALWWAWHTPGATVIDVLFAPIYGNDSGVGLVPLAWQYHFPALLGGLAALWFAVAWSARCEGKATLGARLRGVFGVPDDGMTRFDLSPILALAGMMAAFFVVTAGVLAFLIVPTANDDLASLHNYAGLVLVGLGVVLAVPALGRLRTAQGRAFGVVLARRFAWGQLIFVTLVWGALWLVAAPAQRRFEVAFTRQVQVGEFQIVRKQLGI